MLKNIFLLLVLFSFSTSFASPEAMVELSEKAVGSFNGEFLPTGFKAEKMNFATWPNNVVKQLNKMESDSLANWMYYVDFSDQLDLTDAEKVEMKKNPAAFFDAEYLTEIQGEYKVYRNGVHVGYAIDIIDHAQSQINEDSFGLVIYLDTKMNIVAITDWSA